MKIQEVVQEEEAVRGAGIRSVIGLLDPSAAQFIAAPLEGRAIYNSTVNPKWPCDLRTAATQLQATSLEGRSILQDGVLHLDVVPSLAL